jgi:hypothetical protein
MLLERFVRYRRMTFQVVHVRLQILWVEAW